MEEKKDTNLDVQKEAEKHAYNTAVETPLKPVETFSNQSVTTIKEKKRNNAIFIIIGAFIVMVLLAIVGFRLLLNSPKYPLIKSLETWTDSFEKLTKHTQKIDMNAETQTIKLSGKMNVSAPMLLENLEPEEKQNAEKLLDILNKLQLGTDIRINQKEKELYVGLKGNLENEELFDLAFINKEDHQYLLLKNVLERYLDLGEAAVFSDEDTVENLQRMNEDAKYVWKLIKKSLKKNLKNSYLEFGNEKIMIDGEKRTTKTTTLVLNDKNMTELLHNIVKDLQENKRAREFLTYLYPGFKNYEVELSDDTSEGIYYTVYSRAGKIVKISLKDEHDELNLISGKTDILEFVQNGKTISKVELQEKNDGFKMEIEFPNDPTNHITITQTAQEKEINYQIDATIDTLDIKATYTNKLEKKRKAYQMDMKLNIDVKNDKKDALTIKLDMKANLENKAEIDAVTDSVLVENLTQEEQIKLYSYIERVLGLLGLE